VSLRVERLGNIREDLEATAAHLDALALVLQGHATFLRHHSWSDNTADIEFIESRLSGLAAAIAELRGVAETIGRGL
jgi:hypothetical protein